MLVPKRVKHRKVQRGSMKGKAKGGTRLSHGSWGIQALEAHWSPIVDRGCSYRHDPPDEAWRQRSGHDLPRDKPITKKPAETRMGSGKGNPEEWVAVVKPGRIMFELDGVDEATAKEALRLAINKLPIKCKIVSKETEGQA